MKLIGEAYAAGAGLLSACGEIGICLRTFKRWRKAFLGDGDGHDVRKGIHRLVSHKLSDVNFAGRGGRVERLKTASAIQGHTPLEVLQQWRAA